MKDYIGKVLKFEETQYNSTLRAYAPLLVSINEVGKAYQDLDTGFKFNQDVFFDIVSNGLNNIRKQYAMIIESQIELSKFTSKAIINNMRESIKGDLKELENKIVSMHETKARVSSTSMYSFPVEYEYITIVGIQATLSETDKEKLKDRFSVKIRTEDQNKMYNLLLSVKSSYDNLATFLKENDCDLIAWGNLIGNSNNAMLYESLGTIEIEPYSITMKLKSSKSPVTR